MSEIREIEIQDKNGNIYYPHTDSGVVICDETNLKDKITNFDNTISKLQNEIKNLNQQITQLKTSNTTANTKIDSLNTQYTNLDNKINNIKGFSLQKVSCTMQNGWSGVSNIYLLNNKILIGYINIQKETSSIPNGEAIIKLNGISCSNYVLIHAGGMLSGQKVILGTMQLHGDTLSSFSLDVVTTPNALIVAEFCIVI